MRIISYRGANRIRFSAYYLLLIIASIIILIPIIWMISFSFRPNNEIFQIPPKIIPDTFTIDAYNNVLKNNVNIRSIFNSLVVCSAVTGISIIISSLAGYGFSRFRFRGKQLTTFFILITQMIPPIILLLPYFLIISKLGLYDTYFALIITYVSFTIPFCTLMLRSFFDTTPKELDEAAMIDGCSRMGALLRVILPTNVPSLIATGAFAFIMAWTELLFAVALTSSKNMMQSSVAVARYVGEYAFQWSEIMAFSFLTCVPLVLIWIFLQRYIIEGMTKGSVKY